MKRLLAVVVLGSALGWGQSAASPGSAGEHKPLTIEAIAEGITGRGPETLEWSPDGRKLSFIQRDASGQQGELWYVDAATGKKAVLVGADKLALLAPPASKLKSEQQREAVARYGIAGYHWAPDASHLLFDSQGQLWLYSLETRTASQITSVSDPISDPKFSPDGSRIAYLLRHDLWVQVPGKDQPAQITHGGGDNLLNGEVDWVYEEELDVRSNYFWSPDGRQLLFLQMDESQVPVYPIENFMPTHPTLYMEKYPKAGDPNPAVRVGVVNSTGGKVKWLELPVEGMKREQGQPPSGDYYIPRFGWVRPGLAYVQLLNRDQNQLDLYFVDTHSGKYRRILRESSDTWVDVNNDFRVLSSGDRFLWGSDRDGHQRIYLYRFDKADPLARDAQVERQLTTGDFESSVEAVDDAAGVVYVAANAGDRKRRQLFAVKLDGSGWQRVSPGEGTDAAEFSPDAKHYLDVHSSLMTPPRLAVCGLPSDCHSFWEPQSVAAYDLVAPQFVHFQAEDGSELDGMLILPPGATAGHKVPLILNPYGGPQAQVVRDGWGGPNFLFDERLVMDGFAILIVDNRGMAGRGKKFADPVYHRFGEVELRDQLAALRQALERYPQLDASRLGWWGWSYGGYMTLYAMTHSPLFQAGVSVAPVTDWHDYDSIYTERYMGLPKDNEAGYQKSSPVTSAAGLSGRVLIVHGTGDDNVHFQNTVQMTNALIDAGKQFDLMMYPGKTHGIAGKAARSHLYHLIEEHFQALLGAR